MLSCLTEGEMREVLDLESQWDLFQTLLFTFERDCSVDTGISPILRCWSFKPSPALDEGPWTEPWELPCHLHRTHSRLLFCFICTTQQLRLSYLHWTAQYPTPLRDSICNRLLFLCNVWLFSFLPHVQSRLISVYFSTKDNVWLWPDDFIERGCGDNNDACKYGNAPTVILRLQR